MYLFQVGVFVNFEWFIMSFGIQGKVGMYCFQTDFFFQKIQNCSNHFRPQGLKDILVEILFFVLRRYLIEDLQLMSNDNRAIKLITSLKTNNTN